MTTLLMLLSLTLPAPARAAGAIPQALGSRHDGTLSVGFHERVLSHAEQDAQGVTCPPSTPRTVDICYWQSAGGDPDYHQWLVSGPTDSHMSIDLKTREVVYFRQTGNRAGEPFTARARFTLDPVDLEGIDIPDGARLVRLADSTRRRLWAIAQEAERRAVAD